MFPETKASIERSKGRIAWMEKQIQALEKECASLPTVGYHRARFLATSQLLKLANNARNEEYEYLQQLMASAEAESDLEAVMTPEQLADFQRVCREEDQDWQRRQHREREAEKRREGFKLIIGGKS